MMRISEADAAKLGIAFQKRGNKFKAKRASHNGKSFHSTAERDRYVVLLMQEGAGQITGLRTQPQYDLHAPAGEVIGRYVADFEYTEAGELTTEDVKGFETDVFKWKRRHFEAEYKRPIRVTK